MSSRFYSCYLEIQIGHRLNAKRVRAPDAPQRSVDQTAPRLFAKQRLLRKVHASTSELYPLTRNKYQWARHSTHGWLQLDLPAAPPRRIASSSIGDSSLPKRSMQ